MALAEAAGLASQTTWVSPQNEIDELNARFERVPALDVLKVVIQDLFPGSIAMVSSFGADSSVLLHMVAQIDRSTPVITVDTGKLFPDTIRYRDHLLERLGLTNIQVRKPDATALRETDPGGMLWMSDTDACCHVRKVLPLERALEGYQAWISGRKRFQSTTRSSLPVFELDKGRIKVNPLAGWTSPDILRYAREADLPPHPLVAKGFPSIGCMPCTSKVEPGEDPRAGRWRGQAKTECGIHLPTHGKEIDGSGI